MTLKRPADAERVLQKVLAQNPQDADAQVDLAMFYMGQKQADKALVGLEKAKASNPDNPQVILGYGTYYQYLKQEDKTREYYQRFIALKPKTSLPTMMRVISWLKKHPDPKQPKTKPAQSPKTAASPKS